VTASELVQMLDLDQVGANRYVGRNLEGTEGVVFGGQLLAQSIAAAGRAVPDMQLKSMHTVFARGGLPDQTLTIEVTPFHQGRSFASADVAIHQGERHCTRSVVLFHRPDADLINHHDALPDIGTPADSETTSLRRGWEVKIVDGIDVSDPDTVGPAELLVWSRFIDPPADLLVSQSLLAYASDGFLIGTAMRPHPGVGQAQAHVSISTSVVTQTLTFHEPFDAGDWLLLVNRSPCAGHGRSFGRADVFSTDGRLVASYAQENMIRAFAPDRQPAPGERSKY
jgi:acyl-CoA thioesterase II